MSEDKKTNNESKLTEQLLNTRSIIISGEISQEVAEKVTAQLLILSEISDEPIKIFINSQGGHVEAGDTIHDMIRFVKPEVSIIGTGYVASAGTLIYVAVPKERRYSLPNTRYLIHQPMGGARGQASDIKIAAEQIVQMRARLNKILSDGTGQPYEKIEKDAERDFWLTAQEAVDYGLVGKIIQFVEEVK